MNIYKFVVMICVVVGLTGCGAGNSKFQTYNGPKITHVVISKTDRKMWLIHEDKVVDSFPIDLGFAPAGHKQFEGDGKTPEGSYFIDRRNPNSSFHLSLGISYPNDKDIAFAQEQGKKPGGDIFIHGQPNGKRRVGDPDWTAGCISVKNKHIRKIYAMVQDGTQVTINP